MLFGYKKAKRSYKNILKQIYSQVFKIKQSSATKI